MAKSYSDTFNRANAGSWGTSSDGLVTYVGGIGHSIVSNRGRLQTPIPENFAYTDGQEQCDTDDLCAEVDLAAFVNAGGFHNFYLVIAHPADDSSGYVLGYDGSDILLLQNPSGSVLIQRAIASLVGKRLRVVHRHAFGYLGIYADGVNILSVTDTSLPIGAGYRGIQISAYSELTSSYVDVDNLVYADAAARADAFKRYVKLVSKTAYAVSGYGSDYSTIAELNLLLGGTPLSRTGWSVSASSVDPLNPASNMLDSNNGTYWQSQVVPPGSQPHSVILDCGAPVTFDSVRVRNRNDDTFGSIGDYEVYLSDDGATWGDPIRVGAMNTGTPSLGANFDLYLELLAPTGRALPPRRAGLPMGLQLQL